MVVGMGIMTFRLNECRSLKSKRRIIKMMIGKMRSHFNLSAAEIGANDMHQRAEIGFAIVGNSSALVNSKIDKVFNLMEVLGLAEIIDTELEILHI